MADTNFVNGTVIQSDWLQDVNDFVYGNNTNPVNVKSAGAKGDGSDDTAYIYIALAAGRRLYFPEGTFAFNVTLDDSTIFEGAGSNKTFISPYQTSIAAVTYTKTSPYWTYNSEVRNLCFKGTSKVGIGFTFGASTQAAYVDGMQYANNVCFRNVDFRGLEKGIQFPFGNIGTEFYSCGFHENYYGAYLLDNKQTGDIMHAGNKYWFGGEMNGNTCAVYISNNTNGFGGVAFTDTIIEYNSMFLYCASSQPNQTPIQFRNIWLEGNGATLGDTSAIDIDLWTGSTRTTQSVPRKTFIFDGSTGRYNFEGGNFTDANVAAADAIVSCVGTKVEDSVGYVGGAVLVNTGSVLYQDCETDGGFPNTFGNTCSGLTKTTSVVLDNSSSNMSRRGVLVPPRRAVNPKLLPSGLADPLLVSKTFTGTYSVVGSVVDDGRVFNKCNEFSRVLAPSEYVGLESSAFTSAGACWAVVTVDIKVLAGTPQFYFWDRGTSLFANWPTQQIGIWQTLGAIAKIDSAGKVCFFDVGNPATSTTCTFRVSALQCQVFNTQLEAMQFLNSCTYSYDAALSGWTVDTGTSKRTANATYSATASVGYTQAEVQALMNAVRDATQTIKALKDDLVTQGIIKP